MQIKSQYNEFLELLFQLNYLPDINCQRIFTHLLVTSKILTAKEISENLDLPDSKVYPALNKLISNGLVLKNQNKRPSTYYLNNLHKVEDYFIKKLEKELSDKQLIIERVISQSHKLWKPKKLELDNIAYLFHDREINTEIIRLIKHAKISLMMLFSPNSTNYISLILEKFGSLTREDVEIFISIPYQLADTDQIKKLNSKNNVEIKISVYNGNSYLIADRNLMLNITHRPEADVGLLTNDKLLVKNILECWTDDTCCVLPNSEILDLNVLN